MLLIIPFLLYLKISCMDFTFCCENQTVSNMILSLLSKFILLNYENQEAKKKKKKFKSYLSFVYMQLPGQHSSLFLSFTSKKEAEPPHTHCSHSPVLLLVSWWSCVAPGLRLSVPWVRNYWSNISWIWGVWNRSNSDEHMSEQLNPLLYEDNPPMAYALSGYLGLWIFLAERRCVLRVRW